MPSYDAKNAKVAIEYFKVLEETGSRAEANASILFDGQIVSPNSAPCFSGNYNYALNPKTHVVNGHTVPAPLSEPLDHGVEYHIVAFGRIYTHVWVNDQADRRRLEQNRVFSCRNAALLNDEAAYQYGRFSKDSKPSNSHDETCGL